MAGKRGMRWFMLAVSVPAAVLFCAVLGRVRKEEETAVWNVSEVQEDGLRLYAYGAGGTYGCHSALAFGKRREIFLVFTGLGFLAGGNDHAFFF